MIRAVIQYFLKAAASLYESALAFVHHVHYTIDTGLENIGRCTIAILHMIFFGITSTIKALISFPFHLAHYTFHSVQLIANWVTRCINALLSAIGSCVLDVLEFIGATTCTITKSMQSHLTNTIRSVFHGINLFFSIIFQGFSWLRQSTHKAGKYLTNTSTDYMAWALSKVLGGLTNIFDMIETLFTGIFRSIYFIASRVFNIPRHIFLTLGSLYRNLNMLLNNLFEFLIAQELILVSALQKLVMTCLCALKDSVLFVTKNMIHAAILIVWTIPQAIINKCINLINILERALNNIRQFLWNVLSDNIITRLMQSALNTGHDILYGSVRFIFIDAPRFLKDRMLWAIQTVGQIVSGVPSKLQAAHSVTRSALSGTAGFMFISIPHGLWNKINPTIFWIGSTTLRCAAALKNFCAACLTYLFFTLPSYAGSNIFKAAHYVGKTLWNGPRWIISRLATLISKGIGSGSSIARFFFIDIPTHSFHTITRAGKLLLHGSTSVIRGINTFSNKLLFGLPHLAWKAISTSSLSLIAATQGACSKVWLVLLFVAVTLPHMLLAGLQKSLSFIWQAARNFVDLCLAILHGFFIGMPRKVFGASKSIGTRAKSGISSTHAALAPHLTTAHAATKKILFGAAGFLLLDIPHAAWSGVARIAHTLASSTAKIYSALKYAASATLRFVFVTIPLHLLGATKSIGRIAGSGLRSTRAAVSPKLFAAHAVTKKVVSGAAGFMFLEIPKGLFYSLKMLLYGAQQGIAEMYYGLKAGTLWLAWTLCVQLPHIIFVATTTSVQALLRVLQIFLYYTQRLVRWAADLVIFFIRAANRISVLIETASRILLESILKIPRQIASAIVAQVILVRFLAIALWNGLLSIWDGVCYLAVTPQLAIQHFIDRGIAGAHKTHQTTVSIVFEQRSSIQMYAFLGTGIYLLLVLFSTYSSNYSKPSSQRIKAKHTIHSHATPVTVDLEVHKLQSAADGFGCITIEGILSYSYNTGTEPATAVDDFTVKNAKHYVLKKLGSSVSHAHVTTTRHLLTTTLEPNPRTAITFPFSGAQSNFVIQNNSLSSREIHYQGALRSLTAESNHLGLQKILMEPGENRTHARSSSALIPELTITLEYQRWSPLMLFGLYILLFALMLLSIATLLIAQRSARLTVSGITFCMLGAAWIGCYLAEMLTTINHLMITLLLGLALSTIIIALNASAFKSMEALQNNPLYGHGQFAGQTRWVLILLSMLAITFTMLIRL